MQQSPAAKAMAPAWRWSFGRRPSQRDAANPPAAIPASTIASIIAKEAERLTT